MYNVPTIESCLRPGEVHGKNGSCRTRKKFKKSRLHMGIELYEKSKYDALK